MVLALLLIAVSVSFHAGDRSIWPQLLDVAAAAAATAASRWPRAGSLALGVVLIGYVAVPDNASALGEYAAMIVVLGAGVRADQRTRSWATAGYWVVLTVLTYVADGTRGLRQFVTVGLLWAGLFAVMWIVGSAFASYRRALLEGRVAAVQVERAAVARRLHESVARDIDAVASRVERAYGVNGDPDGQAILADLREASCQARAVLALLDGDEALAGDSEADRSPVYPMAGIRASWEAAGFDAHVALEGDQGEIPRTSWAIIGQVIGEIGANVERHAVPGSRCSLIVSVTTDEVVVVELNGAEPSQAGPVAAGMGLTGLAERLERVGGHLEFRQGGGQWEIRARIPHRLSSVW